MRLLVCAVGIACAVPRQSRPRTPCRDRRLFGCLHRLEGELGSFPPGPATARKRADNTHWPVVTRSSRLSGLPATKKSTSGRHPRSILFGQLSLIVLADGRLAQPVAPDVFAVGTWLSTVFFLYERQPFSKHGAGLANADVLPSRLNARPSVINL